MNREKRVSKAPERLIEQIWNEKQTEKASAVRKPKETKEPKKSLKLDLSNVPVSDERTQKETVTVLASAVPQPKSAML